MSDLRKWKKLVESMITEDPVADADYTDHEVSMAKSQLLSSMKSVVRIAKNLKDKSESEGIEGWVASKITMAEDYLQAVADYMDGQEINEGFKIRDKSRGYGVADKTYKTREEAKKAAIMKAAMTGGDWEVIEEGYKVMPPMDPKYVARKGLEGPFSTLSGKVVYYDPKEGKYYDPDTDMYMSYDEFQNYDKDYSGMKESSDLETVAELIADYVKDHYENFDAYPMDVEVNDRVYDYDEYWAILDKAGIKINESLEESEALTEEQFDEAAGEKDACYHKVKSRYKVWPSAYASGALVKCRKVGAKNWGNGSKK